jgi:putative membrane protein
MLAAARVPDWQPHPDVWLLVGLLYAGYWVAISRWGPRFAPMANRPVTRLQVVCFSLGAAAVWIAADWPVHDIAEQHNYSLHMVQHLTLSMVAVPLLLLGTPAWLARRLLPPGPMLRTAQTLARFFPALVVFNLVLVFTHWPALVNFSLSNGFAHFGVHSLIVVSSIAVWLPILSPLPEVPRLVPPMRMAFLFLESVVPTVPASFMTYGAKPLYHAYDDKTPLWGFTVLDDQRLAGLIMKIGAGILLWLLIAVIFFRWAADEDRKNLPSGGWRDLDRSLSESGTQ